MEYLHEFATQTEFELAYNSKNYKEPWVSYITENEVVSYNKGAQPHDYSQDYLTFEFFGSGTLSPYIDLEYSIDNGQTWNGPDSVINVNNGTKVLFRGNTYGNISSSSMFYIDGNDCYFNMYGNIMSIINSTGFTTATTLQSGQGFMCMFADGYGSYGADKLLSAGNLILPATTLASSCYSNMFLQCTSLTDSPALPATTLAENCYQAMFKGCTSLTTAPALPATTLAEGCYESMFYNCTSLTTAPELPATTLANSCYSNMFDSCTSLTTAPELPATTLAYNCYSYMFNSCTSLNYIKCLATDISANYCTQNWVYGVASSGTFVKNPNMSNWTTGDNGIPTNWTVQDA